LLGLLDDWNRRCSCSVRLNFTYIYNPNWLEKEKEEVAEEMKKKKVGKLNIDGINVFNYTFYSRIREESAYNR